MKNLSFCIKQHEACSIWVNLPLIPHTINLPMSFEGILTNQTHIRAQWMYSSVAICCYGNTSYPQAKPVAERSFFPPLFFSLISRCCSSVSISASDSWGSAESEVECAQAWHKHNKRLSFLGKVSENQGDRGFSKWNLTWDWCKGYSMVEEVDMAIKMMCWRKNCAGILTFHYVFPLQVRKGSQSVFI